MVTDPASVEAAVAVASTRGALRICVVCAGLGAAEKLIGRDGPTPLDAFARVINVNLLGTINALRLAASRNASLGWNYWRNQTRNLALGDNGTTHPRRMSRLVLERVRKDSNL